MIVSTKQVELYVTEDGHVPYEDWLTNVNDARSRGRIEARIARVRLGNLGDCKPVGEGVTELRLDFGPGYRIYLGEVGATVVLLLIGGDKSTQAKDIKLAQEFWTDYETRAAKERGGRWVN